MTKQKYQWNDLGLRQRAKACQWCMLIFGAIGIYGLFSNQVGIVVGAIAVLLIVNIYASQLRKKDKAIRR